MFVRVENKSRGKSGQHWQGVVGARVRELRQARGWTQSDLAQRLTAVGEGMHQTTIAKLEGGSRPTTVSELASLASVFSVPLAFFFDETDATRERLELAALAGEISSLTDRQAELGVEHAVVTERLDYMNRMYEELRSSVARREAIARGELGDE